MNIDAIPVELRALPQWVLWREERRNGKPTKVPCRADGRMASVTAAETWTTWEAALGAVGRFDGLGFVVTAHDPFVGIDLDGCVDVLTLDLSPDAAAIVAALNSYSELSPSGLGVRVFVRGSLNGRRNRRGQVEMYDRNRFLTVTGDHLPGTPATVEERQAKLDEVHVFVFGEPKPGERAWPDAQPVLLDDRELLARAIAAENGDEVRTLYEGGWAGRYGSQSEADLALCSHLAFWTRNDPGRIDRLFRSSGLMRSKWERADYRERTIGKAISGTSEVFQPGSMIASSARPQSEDDFRLEPVDWPSIAAGGVPEIEYLDGPFLPARKRIWGVGPAESGKSIWAAWKAANLTRAGLVVVYVSQENGLEEESRRFLRLRPDLERLRLYVDQGLDLTLAEHRSELLAVSEGAALTVLDTLTSCWAGDEDSNRELAQFERDVLKPLQLAGTSSLVLDHTGNPQPHVRRRGVHAPRGASTKAQKVDFLLEFRANGESSFQVERGKQRGTHGKEARSYRIVDASNGELDLAESELVDNVRDLVAELVELMADGEWWTVNTLRKPKHRGGVGADPDAIKDALTDNRFDSAEGPAIRKRKGSTYHRLVQASSASATHHDASRARVEGEASWASSPIRDDVGHDASTDPDEIERLAQLALEVQNEARS